MTREIIVVFLGIFVALVPYLGVPQSLRETLLVLCGVLLVLLGIGLRHARYRRSITHHSSELHGSSFSESTRKPMPVAPAMPLAQRATPATHAAKIRAAVSTSSTLRV
ncbi:hypothetical protein A3C87_03695 [Candidatus Kaiserbacteria bacterium RIFCSPHIGHO2_02_FULL_49_34]|uniref:Uncharacterized protein n=1 Tax=Candidatus Kaiserbacteria bacterium RIFCSPHIGHO2_02_FULL_49_34 TaxID=1798491 RepID=A0A1F6DJM3_9BACT|nr:MAG: hypothetical protein A3C87_03695 [Candidatus Kaiserbacteria bacterium RIFCSPHIGHO2_02_FULL_49_34]